MRWFRFPREFFVSGVTCSAPRIALETLLACFAVAWRHRESSPLLWSCWARYSVVLRLWHGLGLLWLVSLWESSGPARTLEGAASEMFKPCSRESERQKKREGASLARRFKQSVFLDIPKGGWSNQSVGTGRSPACPAGFCKAFFYVRKDNLFVPLLFKLLSCLHIYTITTFVILLIHTILQPFIKV